MDPEVVMYIDERKGGGVIGWVTSSGVTVANHNNVQANGARPWSYSRNIPTTIFLVAIKNVPYATFFVYKSP